MYAPAYREWLGGDQLTRFAMLAMPFLLLPQVPYLARQEPFSCDGAFKRRSRLSSATRGNLLKWLQLTDCRR